MAATRDLDGGNQAGLGRMASSEHQSNRIGFQEIRVCAAQD